MHGVDFILTSLIIKNTDNTHTSIVDHIFWNEACDEKVIDAGVIHIPDNMSDHCPVYCVVDIGMFSSEPNSNLKPSPPKPS